MTIVIIMCFHEYVYVLVDDIGRQNIHFTPSEHDFEVYD